MTVYIPKMLRLLKQQNKTMQCDPSVTQKDQNLLDVINSEVMTSGGPI
jgi:hypothetical protein